MNFTAKEITVREASSINTAGFILGLFCYPFEAYKYPAMQLSDLLVILVVLALVTSLGVAIGSLWGRLVILASGFTGGAMIITAVFPA